MTQPPDVAMWIDSDDPAMTSRGEALARELALVVLRARPDAHPGLVLRLGPEGLSLRDGSAPNDPGLRIRFGDLDVRPGSRDRSRRQPLGRAVGRRAARVVDATAGLGRDTVLLALMGYEVTAIERSPILASMLADGLRRASADDRFAAVVRDRVHVTTGDARHVLPDLPGVVDVVFLDPMYPPKRKASALAKKSIRLVRALVGDDPDAADLLAVARTVARQRVVVKRPPYAEPLAPAPAFALKRKLVRYDVYLTSH